MQTTEALTLTAIGPALLIALTVFVLIRALVLALKPSARDPFWSEVFDEDSR